MYGLLSGLWLVRHGSNRRSRNHSNWLWLIPHFCLGVAIPLVRFNVLVCVVLSVALGVNALLARGPRALCYGLGWQVAGIPVGILAYGVEWFPEPSLADVFGCLPLLIAHPFNVTWRTRRTLGGLRDQSRLLEDRSRRDSLSGLYNRGHLEECVKHAFLRCREQGGQAVLVLIDLDNFKRINDRYGHGGGDWVIRGFAALLRQALRQDDIGGRYGGDEFCVLLEGASVNNAITAIERLKNALAERPLLPNERITASIGIAGWSAGFDDWEQWVHCADNALYRVKSAGRNGWSVAREAEAGQPPRLGDVLHGSQPAGI
ncbi:GGDEF domain-containing protein [Algiphilus sp. W345]|uniref:diguanylate cyclase n=1 Tax=Banduia mediterranea TaxID=3075609 RepID=A0ABU2WG49_9GAMM|nr:GGDEF domain-containing protein [Algiphilus sp. W345]MDT0496239.1 GGDEF domain-containing protein [Algiphilus sp. W345]